jgi:pimeloyl-ACP methyl ester carboxylesterase
MERARLEGIELSYELSGAGEPVVLIHAGVCADFFAPLVDEPALRGYRLLRYHRVGYGASGSVEGAVSFVQQAVHCRELMRSVGIERAHVAGHSSSVGIALQLALDAPDAVQTLALLDPARPAEPTELHAEMVGALTAALERYRAGDAAGAVDAFLTGVCGPGYRAPLEQALPGAVQQAVADAYAFFEQEIPAVMEWSFGPDESGRVAQPALVVVGERSEPVYRERRDLLLAWLPNAEAFELAGATHLLQVQNPSGLAEALAAFFGRHPISTTV